jgi:hypothetical protein
MKIVSDVIWLAIACVPFYSGGTLPIATLVFVVSGSFIGYIGRQMPMAKQLMAPGFIAGVVGTTVVKLVSRQFGYVFMVTWIEAAWWSAWFAFCWAPLIISTVLRVRGVSAMRSPRN